jgi:hypothetical protein
LVCADYSGLPCVVSSGRMWNRLTLRRMTGVALACLVGAACRPAPASSTQQPATGEIGNAASETPVARPVTLQVGDVAPGFSLPGSDGKEYTLASYRGRQAVVLAWFAKAFTEG